MTRYQQRLKICAACPVPKSCEQGLCDGRKPSMCATLSECPHGLFFVPESELTARFKAIEADHPPFDPNPAPPPSDAAQVMPYLTDPAKRLPTGWERQELVQQVFRTALHDFAATIPAAPPIEPANRGIVTVAGGKYWSSAIVTLKICRHVGIDLPVEMWHLPGEITPGMRAYTQAMGGVTLREGSARGGWELKAHALKHSDLEEVLFLDSDSYATQQVDDFWSSDGFKSTGFLMFPDRPSPLRPLGIEPGDRLKPHIFDAFGLPFIDQRSMEAGQMFVDRARHWRTLCLADWVCQHSNYFFKLLYGDKDSWWLSARLLDKPYYVMPTFWDHEGPALIHYDWSDRVRFVHRVHGKFDLYQASFTTTPQRQERRDQLPLEAQVWEIFEQLKIDMADDIAAHAQAMRAARQRETVVKPDRPDHPKPCHTCGAKAGEVKAKPYDGSKLWNELHNWTASADLSNPAAINPWVTRFVARIECDACRVHAADYVAKNPPDCSSNLALCIWGWTWHDAVNREIGKPRMSWTAAAKQHRWEKVISLALAPLTPDQVRSSDAQQTTQTSQPDESNRPPENARHAAGDAQSRQGAA